MRNPCSVASERVSHNPVAHSHFPMSSFFHTAVYPLVSKKKPALRNPPLVLNLFMLGPLLGHWRMATSHEGSTQLLHFTLFKEGPNGAIAMYDPHRWWQPLLAQAAWNPMLPGLPGIFAGRNVHQSILLANCNSNLRFPQTSLSAGLSFHVIQSHKKITGFSLPSGYD